MLRPDPGTYTVQDAAQQLGMGERDLFRSLREWQALDARNHPTPIAKLQDYVRVKYGEVDLDGVKKHYCRPFVTSRGLAWCREKLRGQRLDS